MVVPFSITGVGVVSPYGEGFETFCAGANDHRPFLKELSLYRGSNDTPVIGGEISNFNPKEFLRLDRVRGFDRLTLVVMEAVTDLYRRNAFANSEDFPPEQVGACLGSSGAISSITEFDLQVLEDPQFVQPSAFPNLVSCAALGYASIQSRMLAFNATLSNGATSGLDSLGMAGLQLQASRARMVLAGGAEVLSKPYHFIQQGKYHLRGLVPPPLSEGGVVFSCETNKGVQARGGHALAQVLGYSTCFSPHEGEGLAWNWSKIESVGDFTSEPVYFLGSDRQAEREAEYLASEGIRNLHRIELFAQFGDCASVSGCYRMLYALVRRDIPSGSLILVNASCIDGNHSLLAMRKA